MSELWYDAEEDSLGVQLSKKKYWKSVEIAPECSSGYFKVGRDN